MQTLTASSQPRQRQRSAGQGGTVAETVPRELLRAAEDELARSSPEDRPGRGAGPVCGGPALADTEGLPLC